MQFSLVDEDVEAGKGLGQHRVDVALGANLLEINPEMKTRVHETLQQLTGLTVARVDLKYKYQSDKRRHVSVR